MLPDGTVFGGEKIWDDYYNFTHHHPIPPNPTPKTETPYLIIYTSMVTAALLIRVGVDVCQFLDQWWRRRRYQMMENAQRVQSAGVPLSPESPYAQRADPEQA